MAYSRAVREPFVSVGCHGCVSTNVDDIVTALTDEISTLEPGSEISSEHALMRRFGVSRATVRGAIGKLEMMHLRRRQGAGTADGTRHEADLVCYCLARRWAG